MKGPLDRTKVVVRHLPPTISQSALEEQIDGRFAGRYNSVVFLPGKNSQKRQSYARVYIDFKRPEDVIEFAEFFDGHVFVNERGTQFKTIVEYAPSQHVPKHCSKKDGREGTIFKDSDYVEFLEFLAKPVEKLPSAEIQLERRAAEQAGATKDAPIITPLMDFVRQMRAAKGGTRRSLSNGKPTRKVTGAMYGSPSSASSRRGSDRKLMSATMYVSRDTAKNRSGKDKSTSTVVPNRHDQQLSDKSLVLAAASATEAPEEENGISGSTDTGKKKILLLKGKVKEIPHVSGGTSLQQNSNSVKNSPGSSAPKQNQRREASGRVIRGILLNKDARQSQSSSAGHSDQHGPSSNLEKERRPPRPQIQMFLKDKNGGPEHKVIGNDLHGFSSEKLEKRTRNKDRPDCGVWTPLRRSDGSHASDVSASAFQSTQLQPDSVEGSHGEVKMDISNARSGEVRTVGSGRSNYPPLDNGSHKHGGRRALVHNVKDDGSSIVSEGKLLKRGGSAGYVPHEKQVWVQKSSAGS